MPARRSTPPRSALGLVAATLVLGFGGVEPLAAQTPAGLSAVAAPSESGEIQRLIREGQHAQALKLIDEALAKNPKDPQMRFRRGVALSMLDRKTEALAVFQKLVDDHPEMPAPYNNIAVIQGAQGDYERARQTLERAIRTNPAYATAYQNLGDVYAQLASQAYTKALQLDKTDATTVQPKLALLRELAAGPGTSAPSAPAPVAAAKPVAKPAPPPTPAVAAPAPPPPPATAPVTEKPASATPAAKPAPPPAAPASAPAATPVAAPAATADVEAAVRAWAAAWSKRDLPAYYAAYTPEFSGQAASRKTWEQDRHDRIAPRKQIKVELVDLQIAVNGDQATAKFKQIYASDALSTSGRKTLQLVRSNGRWLIKQEAVGT
ncbi:MAG TPA: tetratricopeptide repeat protein [Ideonella sp.]|jgi:Flp pilus assembly protein TadD/ketosteroid isomerase-like protein|nr:tetratricopeptide repeat protein [Ideonella sp.]